MLWGRSYQRLVLLALPRNSSAFFSALTPSPASPAAWPTIRKMQSLAPKSCTAAVSGRLQPSSSQLLNPVAKSKAPAPFRPAFAAQRSSGVAGPVSGVDCLRTLSSSRQVGFRSTVSTSAAAAPAAPAAATAGEVSARRSPCVATDVWCQYGCNSQGIRTGAGWGRGW